MFDKPDDDPMAPPAEVGITSPPLMEVANISETPVNLASPPTEATGRKVVRP